MLIGLARKTLHIVIQDRLNRLKHPKRNAQVNIARTTINLDRKFRMQDHLTWRGNLRKTKICFLAHEIKLDLIDCFPCLLILTEKRIDQAPNNTQLGSGVLA